MTGGAAGLSGARIERGVLRDGRRVVLKHLPPGGDWLTRRTDGAGRVRRLWERGVLDRVGRTVEHAVLGVVTSDDGDALVMSDVSDLLLPPATVVTRDQTRALLAGLARMHAECRGFEEDGLCSMPARLTLFSPEFHASDTGPDAHPSRELIVEGWERFADTAPHDVADAVIAVHDRPEGLVRELARSSESTLVHGDAKLENLGLDGDRLVAIDWGDLTGIAPAAIDVAWLAIQDGWRFDFPPLDLFEMYDEVAAQPLDRSVRDLASIVAVTWFGFKLAGRVHLADDSTRPRAEELLASWTTRVRDALTTWSPV